MAMDKSPFEPGHVLGSGSDGIDTPMCTTNVGKKNTPGVHDYSDTWNDGSGGKADIMGAGTMNGFGKAKSTSTTVPHGKIKI